MKQNIKSLYTIIVSIILFSFLWFIFISTDPLGAGKGIPMNLGSFAASGDYWIDPSTILSKIKEKDSGTFLAEEPLSRSTVNNYPWKQEDYMKVADAFHQLVWKESLQNWNFERMRFDADCAFSSESFAATFFVYRTIIFDNRISYDTHEIDISLDERKVSWGGDTRFPRPILGWNSIKLDKLMVPYEAALRIAEEKGGKDARAKVNDQCEISSVLSNYWFITYRSKGQVVYKIQINPYTGNVTQ